MIAFYFLKRQSEKMFYFYSLSLAFIDQQIKRVSRKGFSNDPEKPVYFQSCQFDYSASNQNLIKNESTFVKNCTIQDIFWYHSTKIRFFEEWWWYMVKCTKCFTQHLCSGFQTMYCYPLSLNFKWFLVISQTMQFEFCIIATSNFIVYHIQPLRNVLEECIYGKYRKFLLTPSGADCFRFRLIFVLNFTIVLFLFSQLQSDEYRLHIYKQLDIYQLLEIEEVRDVIFLLIRSFTIWVKQKTISKKQKLYVTSDELCHVAPRLFCFCSIFL